MKTHIIRAATPAIVALAAFLLSFRSTNADSLVAASFCVLGLCAIMALDYRVGAKGYVGR
ncbi:MAG TPA: hypothetical protein VGF85_12650 [Opitutaceae bacterium]|jgi:hypothetical protein